MVTRGKRYQIPDPSSVAPNSAPLIVDRERVLALYNHQTASAAQKVTGKVESWFKEAAHAAGWSYAAFTAATNGNSGGCVLVSSYQIQHQRAAKLASTTAPAQVGTTADEEDDEL